MKRWNYIRKEDIENLAIDLFLEEVIAVSRKHGFSISHEDGHGAFLIYKFNTSDTEWLRNASDNTTA